MMTTGLRRTSVSVKFYPAFTKIFPPGSTAIRIRAESQHEFMQKTSRNTGVVTALFTAPEAGAPMEPREDVRAVPGKGLEGDRYYFEQGSFSRWPGARREVTLIAREGLQAIQAETGADLSRGEHRRSIVTEGIALEELIDRQFRVGEAILRGERPCLPCRHVERLTRPGILAAMKKHGGGLRARVLREGTIRVGDEVELLEAEP